LVAEEVKVPRKTPLLDAANDRNWQLQQENEKHIEQIKTLEGRVGELRIWNKKIVEETKSSC
jgi:hypothetical protein